MGVRSWAGFSTCEGEVVPFRWYARPGGRGRGHLRAVWEVAMGVRAGAGAGHWTGHLENEDCPERFNPKVGDCTLMAVLGWGTDQAFWNLLV